MRSCEYYPLIGRRRSRVLNTGLLLVGTYFTFKTLRLVSSRFDKSVEGILNGRNAAMFVAIETKKRGWNLEFEEVVILYTQKKDDIVNMFIPG